jgi:serine protease
MNFKFLLKASVAAVAIGVVVSAGYSMLSGSSGDDGSVPPPTKSDTSFFGNKRLNGKASQKEIVPTKTEAIKQLEPVNLATVEIPKGIGFEKVETNGRVSDQLVLKIKKGNSLWKKLQSSKEEVGALLSAAAKAKIEIVRTQGDAVMLKIGYAANDTAGRASELNQISRALLAVNGVDGFEEDIVLHPSLVIDDARFPEQWFLTKSNLGSSNAATAWDRTSGSTQGNSNAIAILDTGITKHSDLNANVLPGYDFVLSSQQGADGNSWDADPSDPGDSVAEADSKNPESPFYGCHSGPSTWHGTHVAGIAAAVAGNGVGVVGVAPGAKIIPVRVLGKCGGYMSDVSEGVRWAAGISVEGVPSNPTPAKIINMSLGANGVCPSYLQSAISDAIKAGSVVVVAAGNGAADAKGFTPANCVGVISVGAVGQTGDRTYYSNFGSKVNISAPGGDTRDTSAILSTMNSGTNGPGGETYGFYQGTSMAAPVVSGGIALAMAANPKLGPSGAISLLARTSRAFPEGTSCAALRNCGAGIVDIGAAIGSAEKFVPDIILSKFVPLSPIVASNIAFDISIGVSNAGIAPTSTGQSGKIEIFISEVNGASPMKIGEAVLSDIGGIPVNGTKYIKVQGLKIGSQAVASQLTSGTYGLYANFVGGDWESRIDNNRSKIQVIDYVVPGITLTKKMPINQAPAEIVFTSTFNDQRILKLAIGSEWVYDWHFTSGSVIKVVGPQALISVNSPGSGTATLNLKHVPSGFTTSASMTYEVIASPPSKVTFKEAASNDNLRAPVVIRFMPTVTTGHPLDRVSSITWDIDNGAAKSKTVNAIVTFGVGTHVVKAIATTKMGYTASYEKTFVVGDNNAPHCTLDYANSPGQKTIIFTANCSDQDGSIKGITWYVNGRVAATPFGNPYVYKFQPSGSGTLNVVIRATDDSNAFGEAQVTVAY